MNTRLLRSRWAAIGAAVAVSLGAGGIGIGSALPMSGEQAVYEPITPCRLADTRPDSTVGPRSTPLGAVETYVLSGWDKVGECTLTGEPTALALNVTTVDATIQTFLTLFPADRPVPKASHLNPAPGQPPTPNAVNVDLDSDGLFGVYNERGTVHLIVDVVGLYVHYDGDDIKSVVKSDQGDQTLDVTSPASIPLGATFYVPVRTLAITPPGPGTVVATASLSAAHAEEGDETMRAACGLSTAKSLDAAERLEFVLSDGDRIGISPTRTFTVTSRGSITINLLCRTYVVDPLPPPGDPGSMTVRNSALALTFVPD